MATTTHKTRGKDLADQLFDVLGGLGRIPLDGIRHLPVLEGVIQRGGFEEIQENVLARMIQVLHESQRVLQYGSAIVLETDRVDAEGRRLRTLREDDEVLVGADDWLANVLVCEQKGKQFPPPRWLVELVLRSELLCPALPRVKVYSQRPLFDKDFVFRGPGWHPESGILIHGPSIEPMIMPVPTVVGPALDRLPPRLRQLLAGFCFRSDADLVNAVALLLTGLLVNHFILSGKPIGLIDGNQPNTGKTWLVRAIGILLNGFEPPELYYTPDDEELQKRVCAKLRETPTSVLLIDNAKRGGGTAISSPFIESVSVAPEVSLRILGGSTTYTRPNDLVWFITMNDTRISPDLVSRGVPVQLYYEGRTEDRHFAVASPMEFASQHRLEILGELAGMIVRWNQAGRPQGVRPHRLQHWARIIGGILQVAGLPEFLANAQETAAAFNSAADELAALAEVIVTDNGPFITEDITNRTTANEYN